LIGRITVGSHAAVPQNQPEAGNLPLDGLTYHPLMTPPAKTIELTQPRAAAIPKAAPTTQQRALRDRLERSAQLRLSLAARRGIAPVRPA
jgi:hypothetical protein